ncbi:hypothetical protein [Cellulomonas hominis]
MSWRGLLSGFARARSFEVAMVNLALLDLVRHFVVRGENLGTMHPALAVLRVVQWTTAVDEWATVVRGRCEFNGYLNIDATNGLQIAAGVDEGAAAFDPSNRTPVFDIRETAVDFELFVPRTGSATVAAGVGAIGAPSGFANSRGVLDALASPAPGPAPSDYPATDFTLDLVLEAPRLRPPFLHPAKLNELGLLSPDPSKTEVAITLPRLRFRVSQSAAGLRVELTSAGTSGLDDPADLGVAELISMDPPYAFVGGQGDRVVGIGFRSATLDLSGDSTPAALKEKAGVGDDWTGLYLPEARIFVSPAGDRDFAFEAGVKELLIGFGDTPGLWGDFEAMLVNQGSGELAVGVRFADADGHLYGIERTGEATARARVPQHTQMVVDASGARTPYEIKARIGTAPEQTGRAFQVDVEDQLHVHVTVSSAQPGGADAVERSLDIDLERLDSPARLDTPGPQADTAGAITPGTPTGELRIVVVTRHTGDVVLATEPRDDTLRWSVDGGAEEPASATATVTVAPGAHRTVHVRRPAAAVPATQPFCFTFDDPDSATATASIWTTPATSSLNPARLPGGQASMFANKPVFDALPAATPLTITGQASYEGHPERDQYNFLLAQRRAESLAAAIRTAYGTKFAITTQPPNGSSTTKDSWKAATGWATHGGTEEQRRTWWRADVSFPTPANVGEETGDLTLDRPATPPPPTPHTEPQPETPAAPDFFRSAALKVRIVASELIALEITCEVDMDTFAEQRLRNTGHMPTGATSPTGRTLQNGSAVGPDNPADGITTFRVLCQGDPATGRITTLVSVGADPRDKDGLYVFGWIPGDPGAPTDEHPTTAKDLGRTVLGSYLTFWPLLAEFPPVEAAEGLADGQVTPGDVVNATMSVVALGLPAVIAALPWFQVERVVLFGGEFDGSWRETNGEVLFDGRLLFDIGIDWSANFLDLVIIKPQHPLSVRYKAIGLQFGNQEDDGSTGFVLRPVFDSGRGYTIDLASGGGLQLIDPLGQILTILGARLSKQNPLTFEIEIGLGVDLGVVSVDRAGLRVFLDEPRPPELTALGATVDIPGAILGSGYVKIGKSQDSQGHDISVIAGQLDLTIRPISLRVAAAVAIATIPEEAGGPATGVYVGLNVVLPVGLPLGSTGLGIFGFRGIFGMHYQRNPAIGAGSNVPSLVWLQASGGQPHLLAHNGQELWTPEIDHWAFGLGILIGTMEGGVILNLDGTFLLELPGPRVLIMMNARIVSPPPSLDGLGTSGGILAVIEITPEHFLIAIVVQWEVEDLITIVIPIEAVFPFGEHADEWHIYLGARSDLGRPVTVDVLGIVRGTGYLMFKGDGLPAFPVHNATLPAVQGFGIGLGVGASFTWGDRYAGLYLTIGGGMDAVIGFSPFVLAGTIWVVGELRLFIISIGADAQLTVIVNEQADGSLAYSAHGEACGHVDFFFFEVSGCVEITINSDPPAAPMPRLVDKVSLKSRSPALLAGTGVDRGIDVSLGDSTAGKDDPAIPVVPVDAIPIIAMNVPPVAAGGLTVEGLPGAPVVSAPGLPSDGFAERGGERYRYELTRVQLERVDAGTGSPVAPTVTGTSAPLVWWSLDPTSEPSPVAQLALLTTDPVPATKAIEKTEHLVEDVVDRWGTVCAPPADPAEVLWTFRFEDLGPSRTGWDLEGVAWPDDPGTVRTSAPDTTVRVTERWRSGDGQIDAMRGILPAWVVGGAVPCRRVDVPGVAGPGLVAAEALAPRVVVGGRGSLLTPAVPASAAARGALVPDDHPVFDTLVRSAAQDAVRISSALFDKVEAAARADVGVLDAVRVAPDAQLSALLRSTVAGDALTRGVQLAGLGSVAPVAVDPQQPAGRTCLAKVLQAPMLDDGSPVAIGDQRRADEVAGRLKAAGVTHGPLDDVVVVHTGGLHSADVLLLIERKQLERRIVVRVVGPDDTSLEEVEVDASHLLSTVGLPARWDDPAGPWADDVDDVLAYGAAHKLAAFLVHLDTFPDAVTVEVGTRHTDRRGEDVSAPYWLAAVSTVGQAEVARHDWDEQQVDHDRSVLTTLLGPTPTDAALLLADSLYRVTVSSWGQRQGDGSTRGSAAEPDVQSFWFRTERIADGAVHVDPDGQGGDPVAADDVPALHFTSTPPVPVRLDPWLLATLPGDGESHVFTHELVKLVFATADVERILAAYGKEMRMRVEASSGRHPKETTDGDLFPLHLTADALRPVKATVLSPYEDALLDASVIIAGDGAFCVPIDEERTRHSEVDVPILLDRSTGYILDIELVDVGAPDDARGPRVLRKQFSTGMYRDLDDLADSVAGVRDRHRGGPAGAIAAVAAQLAAHPPVGAEFDDAWRAAGFEPLAVAAAPRVTVVWEQPDPSQPPRPTGVLVESTAPLTRARPYPTPVDDDTGPVLAHRWALADRAWLDVQDASAAGVVTSILRSPGADRYLVVLGPTARGATLQLDLVAPAFTDLPFLDQTERRRTIVHVALDHAPWEDV